MPKKRLTLWDGGSSYLYFVADIVIYFLAGGSLLIVEHMTCAYSFWMGHMMRNCMQTHDGRLRYFVYNVAIIFSLDVTCLSCCNHVLV